MDKKENESGYETIGVSIPVSLIKRMNEYSNKQDIPPYRSHIVAKALKEFLEKRGS